MAAPGGNRRVTIILIVGGVFVALLAAYSLLGSGGGGSGSNNGSTSLGDPATATAGAAPSTTSTTAPAAPTLPNQSFDVFATRNPFEPAVTIDTTPAASTTPAAPTGTPTGTGTGTSTDTTPTTASPNPSAGTTVSVIDVFDQGGTTMARVQVGSTVYTVAAGQTFATSYKVVSLSGTCGQFLYGDSPFTLCENESTTK